MLKQVVFEKTSKYCCAAKLLQIKEILAKDLTRNQQEKQLVT